MGASTIPQGWICPERTRRRAQRLLPRLEDILHKKVDKYRHIPGVDEEALLQEARLLATYAIDCWDRKRGKRLRGWVDVVVRNGLHAEVNWQKALRRAPREAAIGRVKRAARRLAEFVDTDALESTPAPDELTTRQQAETASLVERLLLQLTEDDRRIMRVKLNPPPELIVSARNQHPNKPRISDRLIAEYLKIPVVRIKRALQLAKAAWRAIDAGV